jgi:hypothetical protein
VQEQKKLVVLLSKPAYDFETLISTEHFEVVVCSASAVLAFARMLQMWKS